MINQDKYNVALYLRLSKDDNDGNAESMSISNQRDMLREYVNERGWSIFDIYIDDGYSGTSFDRPDFKRMIRDIEAGKINCVITKDLSRFGRNYAQVGYYTEEYFIEKDVRYIALTDNVDTMKDDNDIAPFKNILNEMYAKDVSRKVKASRRVNARQGKFMGSQVPYGYKRSPEDKHKLIIDEEAARYVREIFERIEKGYSKREIADYFNTLEVPSPSAYYYIRENRKLPRPESNYSWSANTLSTLISNPVYVGDMVQGKRRVASFKTKKRKCVPQEEWIVVRNTHSPIVDRDLWEKVQRPKTNGKVREPKYSANTKENLFKGLIRCGDCGATLSFNTRYHYGEKQHFYRCANYLGKGKNVCSSHCISEDIIKNAVLADIRKNAKLAADEEDRLRQELLAITEKQLKKEDNSMQVKLEKKEKRIKEINMLVRKLFEENVSGIIPADMLESMVNQYHDEKTSLDREVEILKHEISKKKKQKMDVDKWTENMLSVLDLKELDRDTVLTLVDHIEVYEGEEVGRKKQFSLHIHYKFLGPVDTASVGAA